MQAIEVKYLAPTNSRESRFKATAPGGSITISRDYALDTNVNKLAAATALFNKLGWNESFESLSLEKSGELANHNTVFILTLKGE
jgi:hypothetical protein